MPLSNVVEYKPEGWNKHYTRILEIQRPEEVTRKRKTGNKQVSLSNASHCWYLSNASSMPTILLIAYRKTPTNPFQVQSNDVCSKTPFLLFPNAVSKVWNEKSAMQSNTMCIQDKYVIKPSDLQSPRILDHLQRILLHQHQPHRYWNERSCALW